jgi:hypothetical protein
MERIEKIPVPNGLKNEVIKCKKVERPEVKEGMFPLHTLAAFIGARNSGKTNAAIVLTKRYWDDKSINKIFMISPTYDSNPELQTLEVDPKDVYRNSGKSLEALSDILNKVAELAKEYKEDKEYEKVWKRYLARRFTLKDQIILESREHKPPLHMKKPSCLLFIDDMAKTGIYSTSAQNPFNNLCILHRHVHQVGITILMLVQNFKAIPLKLRQNIQQFFIWTTNDMNSLKSMYEEFGNVCSYETFLRVYQEATEKSHHFLTVDPFNPIKELRFRQNFETYLKVPFTSAVDEILELKKRKRNRFDTSSKDLSENESESDND